MELLWIADRGVWVCGADTAGWSFELPSGTTTTGVRFRPGAGGSILGLPAPALVDRRERLGNVLSDRVERSLDDALTKAATPTDRRRALERFVLQRMEDPRPEPMVVAAALLGRSTRPIGTLERVAGEFGVSSRHFRRRFTDAVGYSPAYYARIVRIQRFLRLAADRRDARLAELAATAGYTDQAHLNRDCVALARMTPRRLVAAMDLTSVEFGPFDGRSIQDGRQSTARGSTA
jgi:AraC-like DNA-binding protein